MNMSIKELNKLLGPELKKCSGCRVTYPANDRNFTVNGNGLYSLCKKCKKERELIRNKGNKVCIYEIIFPDGKFYIGCTTKKLKYRLHGHFKKINDWDRGNRTVVQEYAKANGWTEKDLIIQIVEEFESHTDAEIREAALILKNFKNKDMLNLCIRLYRKK